MTYDCPHPEATRVSRASDEAALDCAVYSTLDARPVVRTRRASPTCRCVRRYRSSPNLVLYVMFPYPTNRFTMIVSFCPPNPNELLTATSTRAFRASFGT